jgi:hypothetical protein
MLRIRNDFHVLYRDRKRSDSTGGTGNLGILFVVVPSFLLYGIAVMVFLFNSFQV